MRESVVRLLDRHTHMEHDPIRLLARCQQVARYTHPEPWACVAALDGWDWLYTVACCLMYADPIEGIDVAAAVRAVDGVETYEETKRRLERERIDAAKRLRAELERRRQEDAGMVDREDRYWQAALDGCVGDVLGTAPGEDRHGALYRAAYSVGGLVEGMGRSEDEARGALETAGRAAGLSERDVVRTVARGLAAGRGRPRGMPR